ncbi:hypothetical protein B0H13DRAFT_1853041 [Mycena leptocephala]|nr:hypothetical protein B0H13DRAFT_1853041 [Mycena leptocephala]
MWFISSFSPLRTQLQGLYPPQGPTLGQRHAHLDAVKRSSPKAKPIQIALYLSRRSPCPELPTRTLTAAFSVLPLDVVLEVSNRYASFTLHGLWPYVPRGSHGPARRIYRECALSAGRSVDFSIQTNTSGVWPEHTWAWALFFPLRPLPPVSPSPPLPALYVCGRMTGHLPFSFSLGIRFCSVGHPYIPPHAANHAQISCAGYLLRMGPENIDKNKGLVITAPALLFPRPDISDSDKGSLAMYDALPYLEGSGDARWYRPSDVQKALNDYAKAGVDRRIVVDVCGCNLRPLRHVLTVDKSRSLRSLDLGIIAIFYVFRDLNLFAWSRHMTVISPSATTSSRTSPLPLASTISLQDWYHLPHRDSPHPAACAAPVTPTPPKVMFWLGPDAKKLWLFGLALAFSGFGSSWLWHGLGLIGAKAKAKLSSLPKALAQAKPIEIFRGQGQAKKPKPKPKPEHHYHCVLCPFSGHHPRGSTRHFASALRFLVGQSEGSTGHSLNCGVTGMHAGRGELVVVVVWVKDVRDRQSAPPHACKQTRRVGTVAGSGRLKIWGKGCFEVGKHPKLMSEPKARAKFLCFGRFDELIPTQLVMESDL